MPSDSAQAVQAVSLKLPQFWSQQPRVWFTQTEAQFGLRGITSDDTKFNHVVAALDQDTALRVLDLLENPPDGGRYTALKTRLLDTFTLSEYERAGRLLRMPELGDDKPSLLMDKMRVFLDRMPDDLRATLVHSGVSDMRELARSADQLWQTRSLTTASVRKGPGKKLLGKPANSNLCYYHHLYGKKAHKCQPPCKFVGEVQDFVEYREPINQAENISAAHQ
ncbi:uncharacterized protein LOC131891290 [Tigriopus californicus]|uniref:uncharacterized protein LOC131891290 n=1 Tax=Tigriopus californicus TaxID=6832 RepID=UPI0027DA86AC|nr:uncharacterized protein LOC131891290 [Tigriopus californicus]